MAIFEFMNAQELGDACRHHEVKYLFSGKFRGHPLYLDMEAANCVKLVNALVELGFQLTEQEQQEISRGKDFIQLRNGPFDLDLIFAPDGIERFDDAWQRRGREACPSRSLISMTLWEANRRQTARKTRNPCRGYYRSWSG
jgi:hypothetical protein